MAKEDQTLLGTFGMEWWEIAAATEKAQSLLGDDATIRGMNEFTGTCPAADKRRGVAIRGISALLGDAGTASMIYLLQEDPSKLDSWEALLDRVLVHPPCYRDLADWWLFFTALDAATGFQLERCTASKREARLTGHLLEALAAQGKVWSEAIAAPITRTGAVLAISEIDLEIGGGEQSTGGDFGLILDFDGSTVQPGARKQSDERRIVPLIFQAKRYARPTADVSQTNFTRGAQRTILASNSCASAYIFYENLGDATTPFPQLVKPVETVPYATTTDVLEDSLDFATYLLRAATNPVCAPRANSADDALRMIFSKAALSDLSALVVVSSDPGATNRYRSSLSLLKHMLRHHGDEEEHVDQS
ncbi:hypothetical protein G6N74_28300 [Mesorhizobium sp. CGMCC 1.15528]|uniref:Uncharacterized protein n=1 Tax=Mesorhizobium zhangyense TaxID=1776730 RepID=A0A7C9RBI4_9HYPH|nr:hypothetical protein [Mesorhizobium zhangyense]NGN44962.1 hypothetical protein [Mesorhizobium zhangyense]